MKKVFKILVVGLFVALGSCSEETTENNQITNKIEAKTLKEFYSKYGKAYSTTNFDSQNQTTVTLPEGSILEIPYGAFSLDGKNPYFGIVKIISREFTTVSDLALSNFQTVDIDNRLLATGGSYEMLFLDENNNKLFLNEDKKIELKFPARIESEFKNRMNVYDGNFIKNLNNNNELLYWTLSKNEKVNLKNNYYEYVITPEKINGQGNNLKINNRPECIHLRVGSREWLNCMGMIRENWDIAFWDDTAVNFNVNILGVASQNETAIMVFPGNQPGFTNLIFNSQNNLFTTASGNIENVGNITIAAFSVDNGEFKFNIISSDTGVGTVDIELHNGTVEDFNSQLSSIVN